MTDLDDIAALADELTNPHQHTERVPYWDGNRNRKWREHRTVQPGLLAQLAEVWESGARVQITEEGGGRPIPTSRPPASIDAASVHIQITIGAVRWCWSLQLAVRATVEGNLRALVGAAGSLDDDTRIALADELRHWRNAASVLTGWRTPPYQPYVPCPETDCRRRGKLRVNLERRTAMCLACGSVWGTDQIEAIADYVRKVTEEAA